MLYKFLTFLLFFVLIQSQTNQSTNKNSFSADSIYNSTQVIISAVLFEANIEEMNERGINWTAILSQHGLRIGSDFRTLQPINDNNFDLSVRAEGNVGSFSGYANALLRFFENEHLGEIISRLSVTVSDGQSGRMQVGSDISLKQLDFAGNVIETFVPTGTIIEVIPYIHCKDNKYFAKINVNVERSIPYTNDYNTEIKKTSSKTDVIMFNNEEAIIGGLLVTQDIVTRKGVPVLKDLPWWVLGLKYLFGYDYKVTVKKEVVILLRADIIPALKDREPNNSDNLILEKRLNDIESIEKYRNKKVFENEKK